MRYTILTLILLLTMNFGFAQISVEDLDLKLNKSTNQLEISKKSDRINITNKLKINSFQIDIFDKYGNYAGSMNLKDLNIPLQEISPDEILMINFIELVVIETGQKLQIKNIRLN